MFVASSAPYHMAVGAWQVIDYFDMYEWLGDVSSDLGFVLIKQYEMQAKDNLSLQPRLAVTLTMATYRSLQ